MSRTYKATGINLKSMPLGESDRLLTILTREFGLIKAVAPGSRKQNSSLGGRSSIFVVNELLIAKGRSLDKITQAETYESYPGLSRDLGKLAASQYIAEMALYQALSEQPQEELFYLLNKYLSQLEQLSNNSAFLVLVHLTNAVFQLLTLAGIKPQVQACCLTQRPLIPNFSDANWRVGFSVSAGGTVSLPALEHLQADHSTINIPRQPVNHVVSASLKSQNLTASKKIVAEKTSPGYQTINHQQEIPKLNVYLNATELALLQQLELSSDLTQLNTFLPDETVFIDSSWQYIEQILRQYTQYHLGRPIRSAALIDSYFAALQTSFTNHDAIV